MAKQDQPGRSKQPRKQRKAVAEAPLHQRRKMVSAHLSEDLMLKYERRSMPVRTGDDVRIIRGDFAGEEGEVLEIDRDTFRIEIDGITNRRADGTQVARPIHASNVIITDLHLTDPYRREALERKGVEVEEPEPEPEPEDEAEPEAEPEPEPEAEAEPEVEDEAAEEPAQAPEPEPEPEVDEDTAGQSEEPAGASEASEAEPEPEEEPDQRSEEGT